MKTKHSIETMQQLAESKGMKFLSNEYFGISKHHLWKCANGHDWWASPDSVKLSVGKCNECYGKIKLTYERINAIIEKRGGKLLSKDFKNVKSYIKILCEKNHTWETQVGNIRDGKWCPYCAKNVRLSINEAHKLAEERGGKCLSTAYTNANQLLEWQCSEGHVWKAKYGNVYWGNWCKKCSESLGERICKEFFEQLFRIDFPKSYPEWLINKEGNILELDGYCEELKIAFEHQGTQHFEKTRLFTKDEKALEKRKRYDEIKRRLCNDKGIYLIEIPEVNKYLKVSGLKSYIKQECLNKNIILPINFDEIEVDYNKVYRTPQWREKLEDIKRIAKLRGGECLSTSYETNSTHLLFRCKEKHEFSVTPQKIKYGRWCRKCATVRNSNKKRGTIEQMQELAKSRGGKCLSIMYVSSQTKIGWECKDGHTWDAIPSSITKGSWCGICAHKKNKLAT